MSQPDTTEQILQSHAGLIHRVVMHCNNPGSVPDLEQVLQQLVHHGVLSGQRGPRGGYTLARESTKISVGEIVRIVRGLEGAVDPASELEGSDIGLKVVRPVWTEIQSEMMERLDALTIAELCRRANALGIGTPRET